MNVVHLLRSQAGVTQQALAERGGTSQPTIASYESGAKSPTLATLQRLALSLELELIVTYAPRLTREDLRSLAYHRVLADKLKCDPIPAIKQARKFLGRMRRRHRGAQALFARWRVWLNLPIDELISSMLDPGLMARDMRQVTPFAGLLNPAERVQILKQFRKEYD